MPFSIRFGNWFIWNDKENFQTFDTMPLGLWRSYTRRYIRFEHTHLQTNCSKLSGVVLYPEKWEIWKCIQRLKLLFAYFGVEIRIFVTKMFAFVICSDSNTLIQPFYLYWLLKRLAVWICLFIVSMVKWQPKVLWT